MIPAVLAESLKNKIDAVLKRLGANCIYKLTTNSSYVPGTSTNLSTEQQYIVTASPPFNNRQYKIGGVGINAAEFIIEISANNGLPRFPVISDRLNFNGTDYVVVSVGTEYVGNTPVLHRLYLNK